jgi:hypothetical protein
MAKKRNILVKRKGAADANSVSRVLEEVLCRNENNTNVTGEL